MGQTSIEQEVMDMISIWTERRLSLEHS